MENKNVLLVNPPDSLLELYNDNENIIFLDYSFWYFYSDRKREKVLIEEFVKFDDVIMDFNVFKVIGLLRDNIPLWSRWTDRGDQFEQYFRQALFDIFKIYYGLKKFNIVSVVFPTSISHHLDTLIIEIACRMSNAKQIFPYNIYSSEYNSQYGRLLPFVQKNGVSDRIVIEGNVSDYKYDNDLKDILNYARNRIKDSKIFNRKSTSYYLATFWIIFLWFKLNFKRGLKKILVPINKNKSHFGIFPSYSIITHLKQMTQQKNAIIYYKMRQVSKRELKKHKDNISLLIAAHYQPEATSFPEGGTMYNHIDIVFELRSKGFTGNIFYKEHPGSFLYSEENFGPTRVGQYRSIEYYQQLEKLGCILIDSHFELSLEKDQNHWYLPVTITGSIALERGQAGFHTIITGYPWYKGLPGTINLSDINSLASINSSWVTENKEISKKAYSFLRNLLNNKTVFNGLGIGTGAKINDEDLQKVFNTEFDHLIKHLITNNNNNIIS